jgi:hypothetical protein
MAANEVSLAVRWITHPAILSIRQEQCLHAVVRAGSTSPLAQAVKLRSRRRSQGEAPVNLSCDEIDQ